MPLPSPQTNAVEFTVSGLSQAIRHALEEGFGHVRLRGEISGYRGPHSSGHCYFALKDDKAKIDAVIWRGVFQRLKIKPQEGLEVIAEGRVTTFPNSSKYQIVIESMEPAGVGALMALLEERKKKLAAEGLFAEARKRKLPFLPAVVGIVTSPSGAVIRDMLHGFNERFPARVLVWPVRVQGETCAAEVAAAIRGFNALPAGGAIPRPDVLIVARGGGSLEDLWGFNEEIVARAAAESAIPLISAVGHETDWTLIDLAADARAPTPTKAAEWAVPKYTDLADRTAELALRLSRGARRAAGAKRSLWAAAARGLPRLHDLLALPRQRFDAAERRLGRALLASTHTHAMRLARVSARLSPALPGGRLAHLCRRFEGSCQRGREALGRRAGMFRRRFERISGRLRPASLAGRLVRGRERLSSLEARGHEAIKNRLRERLRKLDALGKLLVSLGYRSVLGRGYALVRDEDGRMLRCAALIGKGDRLDIEFSDGRVPATATEKPSLRRTAPAGAATPDAAVSGPPPAAEPAAGSARAGRSKSPAKPEKPAKPASPAKAPGRRRKKPVQDTLL